LEVLLSWVKETYKDYEVKFEGKWKLLQGVNEKQQENSVDCGVFVMKYAEEIMEVSKIDTIQQKYCQYYRIQIAYSIINNEKFIYPTLSRGVVNRNVDW
jgi:Ulp1 family protease